MQQDIKNLMFNIVYTVSGSTNEAKRIIKKYNDVIHNDMLEEQRKERMEKLNATEEGTIVS